MTRNLKIFALFSLAWSIPYFALLGWAMDDSNRRWLAFWIAYLVFGAGLSITARTLGRADSARQTRSNMRLQYFLAALISSAVVGITWEIFIRNDSWLSIIGNMGIVILVFIVGFAIFRRFSIKGMDKKELFK